MTSVTTKFASVAPETKVRSSRSAKSRTLPVTERSMTLRKNKNLARKGVKFTAIGSYQLEETAKTNESTG